MAGIGLVARGCGVVAFMAVRMAWAQGPIATVAVEGVTVSGAIEVSGGNAVIGSSGTVTAGEKTAKVVLPGRGELRVCQTTTVHLSRERAVNAPADSTRQPVSGAAAGVAETSAPGALMMALDRGALEANYTTGKYSDVLMTPDFRILISGPGMADVRIRVSQQGDTCVENRGENAPYVTVSSQLEEGLYRVQPGQRVLFEHGSLREVVDHEPEPCGCPLANPVAGSPVSAEPGPADQAGETGFPLAQSEGLAPTPIPAPSPAGETHTQVTVPLVYNGAAPAEVTPDLKPSGVHTTPAPRAASAPDSVAKAPSGGVFHRIGRFFSRLFGK